MTQFYKLIGYIPNDALEAVKSAIFAAGAGKLGNYDCCSWQTLGMGQFRPLDGANPAIGELGALEVLEEWRVETIVAAADLQAVVAAYKAAHPYETPAYEVYAMVEV